MSFNGAVTVDMPVAAGNIVGTILILNGAVTVDMPVAAGSLARSSGFDGAVTVDFPSVAGIILNPTVFSGAVKVNMPVAAGKLGGMFSGAVTVNMPTVAGGIVATLPSFNGAVTVDFPSVAGTLGLVTPEEFTCLVMNLKNKVVSIYENYNFNSACRFNGVDLGADSATGIHILSGADDNGVPIAASITLGDSDFGLPNVKMIPEMFIDYSGAGLEVFVARDQTSEMGAADNEEKGPYLVPATADGKTQTKRAKLPGGFRAGHWQFRIQNVDGGAFNIQSIGIPVEKSQRRLN